jgi:hypothetical protein
VVTMSSDCKGKQQGPQSGQKSYQAPWASV